MGLIAAEQVITARIGDLSREFATQEAADRWLALVRERFAYMESIGLIKLINGHDPRWGRNGHEHMGAHREPGRRQIESVCGMLNRAGGYIGKWMTLRRADDPPDSWPLDLDGKIKDTRPLERAPFPYPAAKVPGSWQIAPSWFVGADGYYWHRRGDVLLIATFADWTPAAN